MLVYKKIFFLLTLLCVLEKSLGQTYADFNKKCSEILKGVSFEDSLFGVKLLQRDSCLIGLKAPFFDVTTIDNEKFNSNSLNGKVIFLNFWFTSCKPCVEEMPILNKIVRKYKNSDIEFISFATEDSMKLREFLMQNKFNFKVIANSGQTLIDTFKLFSIWPTSVIIDKKGIIRLIKIGEIDFTSTNKIIEDLLK